MICIVGTRRSGKTRKLLEMSHDTGLPIAVKTEQQAVNLARAARALGLGIPDVLIRSHTSPQKMVQCRSL